MKNTLLVVFILSCFYCSAHRVDSTFSRHQFSLSITNGMSHFFLSNNGQLTTHFTDEGNGDPFGIYSSSHVQYIPDYSFQFGLKYSLGLAKWLRFETGIGYFLMGNHFQVQSSYQDEFRKTNTIEADYRVYLSYVRMPVHFKFVKSFRQGAFTCTLGSDLNMAFHGFTKETNISYNGNAQSDRSSGGFGGGRPNLSVDFKIGYEMRICKNTTMDVGPSFLLNNLIGMDETVAGFSNRTYNYCIGLDLAFYFGFKNKR